MAFDLAIAACSFGLIAVAAIRPITTTPRARAIGCALVVVPLPAAVAVHLFFLHTGRLDQALFASALLAFGLGAVLVLGRDDGDDRRSPGDPDPHWWPEFEREFRTYARSRSRPPVRAGRR